MEEKKIWAVKDGYLVNRDGSIYKLNWNLTGTMRKVKQAKDKYGYPRFSCNGKTTLVHRFIAKCFIPNPQNLPCINHKDENKTNNCVDNLEWCDCSYNNNYGKRNEKISKTLTGHYVSENSRKNNQTSQPNIKTVFQYTKNGVFVREWCSLNEIGRVLGFDITHISECCRGKAKSAYNFIWKFADNNQQETFSQISR